ncbi:MAG: phosphodiester glycosidase family protein [Ferruginibacter sp.]
MIQSVQRFLSLLILLFILHPANAQHRWVNADSSFGWLPAGFHIYQSSDSLDGKPCIAYYAEAVLNEPSLIFAADTVGDRRITPKQFYEKDEHPLLVVNCSFFSYETNRSVNLVMNKGRILAYNTHSIPMRGKDTFQYRHPLGSAIGISKGRKADVAWVLTDSGKRFPYASQLPALLYKDSIRHPSFGVLKDKSHSRATGSDSSVTATVFKKWKMQVAVGGGPVLLQNGEPRITNEEELKFTGKAILDKHPRTCMGYTLDGRLIIMVIEGRHPGRAEGATLMQQALLLKELGCVEALNLDGGGSSCMLINGKETIQPSEKGEERPVPAVFLIRTKQ